MSRRAVLHYARRAQSPRWGGRRVFHSASAVPALVCVFSLLAQHMGWGTLLAAGVQAGSRDGLVPPKEIAVYGLTLGRFAVPFALIALGAAALPVVWVGVVLIRWICPRAAERDDAPAA